MIIIIIIRQLAATLLLTHDMVYLHSRSGKTVGNWVGNQLAARWDTRLEWGYFKFLAVAYPESKNPVGY